MTIENFAGTIIIDKNKILLVQQSHKEAAGLWSLPVGHVEKDEEIETGAVRETKEETSLDVILDKEYKTIILSNKDFKSVDKFDNCEIKLTIYKVKNFKGILKKGVDVSDVRWFNISDINHLELRGSWINYFILNLV